MLFKEIFQSSVIRNIIFYFLHDEDKLKFTSCNKFLYSKRTSIIFTNIYRCKKEDISWKYYNQLTRIKTQEIFRFPENLECLIIPYRFYFANYRERLNIPENVKVEFDHRTLMPMEKMIMCEHCKGYHIPDYSNFSSDLKLKGKELPNFKPENRTQLLGNVIRGIPQMGKRVVIPLPLSLKEQKIKFSKKEQKIKFQQTNKNRKINKRLFRY